MSCIPQASEQGAGVAGGNSKGKIADAQTQGIENLQDELSAHPSPHNTKLKLQYSGTSYIPQYLCCTCRALQRQGSFFSSSKN